MNRAVRLPQQEGGDLLPAGALDLDEDEVAARLAAARRRGRPRWPWPEVEPDAWEDGLSALAELLRARLAGERRLTLTVPTPDHGRGLAIAAFSSGTGPLLGRWLERGELRTTPELGALLALHLEHGRRRWERVRAVAASTVERLAPLGVEPILLKGAHTAAAFFPEPGTRPCGDVDLAVPAAAWRASLAALERAGYVVLNRQERMGRTELLPPGEGRSLRSLHLLHHGAPIAVDLHAGLDREFYRAGRLALGEARPDEVLPCPGIHPQARVLGPPALLVTLAAHASCGLDNLTLLRMVELIRVARAEEARGGLDWDRLLARAGRACGLRFLFPSLEMAERLAPGTVPASVRRTLRAEAPPLMRRIVDGLRPGTTQRAERRSLAEPFMWASGPAELAGRLVDMAWPASAGGSWSGVRRIYADRLRGLVRPRPGASG